MFCHSAGIERRPFLLLASSLRRGCVSHALRLNPMCAHRMAFDYYLYMRGARVTHIRIVVCKDSKNLLIISKEEGEMSKKR